jgi:putative heme-binding domain-containing protein
MFATRAAWTSGLTRTVLLPRVVRRYASEGTADGCEACAALIRSARDVSARHGLWESLDLGLRERPAGAKATADLVALLRDCFAADRDEPALTRVLARLDVPVARNRLRQVASDHKQSVSARTAAIATLGEVGARGADFLALALHDDADAVRLAALAAWARTGTEAEARELNAAYPRLPAAVQAGARSQLLGLKTWASLLLKAVEIGTIPAKDFASDELFAVAAHHDPDLDALVHKHWGNVRGRTPEEKLAEVRRFNNDLRAAGGDPKPGKLLFTKHCASCHTLHGEGGKLGPDLTHANRADRDFLLVSLVDPSAVIRKEYLSYTAEMTSGRVVTGIITAQTGTTVTLTNSKAEATTLSRDIVTSLRESPVSLMPEGLLTPLKPQELRDLFAYLQKP